MNGSEKPTLTAIVCTLILTLCPVAPGRTIRVANDAPADFHTIQAAVDDANDGDTVLVAPGTYTGDGNRDIDVWLKAITIRSEEGPGSCIIDCGGSAAEPHQGLVMNIDSETHTKGVIEGFTITGGYAPQGGGGILCLGGDPRIINCIVTGNSARLSGGGIVCGGANPVVANCIISGNVARDDAGGISLSGSPALLVNCLITGNRADGEGSGVACHRNVSVVNCTITGNRGIWLPGEGIYVGGITEDTVLTVQNSIVCGNDSVDIFRTPPPLGGSNLSRVEIECSLVGKAWRSLTEGRPELECPPLDQLFARVGYWDPNGTPGDPSDDLWIDGDYHLKSQAGRWDPESETWVQDDVTSPCIDAGDPNSPIGYEPFPNGGRINMGAYGGTAEASKSYFGEPVCETPIAGDLNGDCIVDFEDFKILASHWMAGVPAPPLPPDGEPEPVTPR